MPQVDFKVTYLDMLSPFGRTVLPARNDLAFIHAKRPTLVFDSAKSHLYIIWGVVASHVGRGTMRRIQLSVEGLICRTVGGRATPAA